MFKEVSADLVEDGEGSVWNSSLPLFFYSIFVQTPAVGLIDFESKLDLLVETMFNQFS